MAHDAFISCSSKDKTIADMVCARLESRGIRCWIAPRDVRPGRAYGEEIIDAIHECKVLVLVLSANANMSPHIPKEIERAVSRGIPIIPLRIEDVTPAKSLDYFISSVHWLDAMTPPLEEHLESLATTILAILPERQGAEIPFPSSSPLRPPGTLSAAPTPSPPVGGHIFCTNCGTSNPSSASSCTRCGSLLRGPGAPASPTQTVPNYLVWSILATVLCCLPAGVVSIVYAAQVNSKLQTGDVAGAVQSSKNAKLWCWVAFGVGIAVSILGFVFGLFSAMMNSQS